MAHCGVRTGIARDLFEMAVRGLITGDLNDVSLLHLLLLIRGHGSINTLFSIEGGSQENMVEGGAGEIARRVAVALGDSVHLDSPVTSISKPATALSCTARTSSCRPVTSIVAVPPALTLEIDFDPALPDGPARAVPQLCCRPGVEDAGGLRRTVLARCGLQRADVGADLRRRGDARRDSRCGPSGRDRRRSRSPMSPNVSTRSTSPTAGGP